MIQAGGECVKFEMSKVVTVKLSPNHSNIMYICGEKKNWPGDCFI